MSGEGRPEDKEAIRVWNVGCVAFAGLWDAWKDHEGHWLQSFTIVTTDANELMSIVKWN